MAEVDEKDIKLRPVSSSHVDGIGYDEGSQKLVVSYRGRKVVHEGVTKDVAARAEEASKTVTRRVEQQDAWDELRADVQLLTEIARADHALIVDLLDRVAQLEARAGTVHDG